MQRGNLGCLILFSWGCFECSTPLHYFLSFFRTGTGSLRLRIGSALQMQLQRDTYSRGDERLVVFATFLGFWWTLALRFLFSSHCSSSCFFPSFLLSCSLFFMFDSLRNLSNQWLNLRNARCSLDWQSVIFSQYFQSRVPRLIFLLFALKSFCLDDKYDAPARSLQ